MCMPRLSFEDAEANVEHSVTLSCHDGMHVGKTCPRMVHQSCLQSFARQAVAFLGLQAHHRPSDLAALICSAHVLPHTAPSACVGYTVPRLQLQARLIWL